MYLMNVPPVAVTQTEWRTCGPPGGYSLPVCFNDSDSELSTRGTPISNKVQMIIESLRSTQSSLEMGDEIEGNVPSGQDGHTQVCKVPMGSYGGAKSKSKGATENPAADVSSAVNHESSDSDSDDSVDRGIEEAILEYLKEKDGHKRKAEPCFTFLQSSKIPRKNPSVPEVSKQNSDGSRFTIPNSQIPKETPTAAAVIPIKKYIKHKAFLNENAIQNSDSHKSQTKTFALPKEQDQSPSKTISLFNKVKCSVTVKLGEESNDSSSDDGIEEAIQRYQLEKKEQQNKREAFNPHGLIEESDSTSDDGIEEAIQRYQLEQLKEKREVKPFLHKQKTFSKSLMHVGSSSTENMKKRKLKKKKSRAENEGKAAQPLPSSFFLPSSSESSKSRGNGLHRFEMEGFKEQVTPTPAPPKVNTTAELMCAEAILDISKTVMPEAFHQSFSSCAPSESSVQSSLPDNGQDEESDGSSIDSEDGIEQEIRKFLEQKAQMHKQSPDPVATQEPQCSNEAEEVKEKQVTPQKKPPRLSLTQRRKHREEIRTESKAKETSPTLLPEHRRESSQRKEQSGDKSSSLDSDEDLDTAIKDLLKTKKKLKKKTRDLKSKKCLKDKGLVQENLPPQPKKLKQSTNSKRSALKKVQKVKDDMRNRSGMSRKTVLQHKRAEKSKEQETLNVETAPESKDTETDLHKEESSSVDSDDSIEQEIRKFLAEKAKVSTPEKSKDDVSRNGTDVVSPILQEKDTELENQLAEIPIQSASPVCGESQRDQATPQRDAKPTQQTPQPDVSSSGVLLHMSSVLPCDSNLLEPADGAGAARTEPNTDVQNVTSQTERVRPSPSVAHSLSESIKWRQSLGLPTTDPRTLSRTPFHITSTRSAETSPYQSGSITPKPQTPVPAWSSSRISRPAETTVNTTFRPSVLNLSSIARQHPRTSFTRGPVEAEAKSMVHISKDKSVFVELESNRTNHVQVRSRERREGQEGADMLSERRRQGESVKINERGVHLERREDAFVDETDCESGRRRDPEKKQGFPALSLSSAIDPGITIKPCIALTSEERSMMFNRRYHTEKSRKGLSYPGYVSVQRVKRKLQFIQVNRENVPVCHPTKHQATL
ncbi:protein phosphatase 1 regulatory subunit 26 [Halichoeres trimaculatus]|uniref:protein phosphatase 1 regulatory subunit 26 n=1 Tax=Halichoeres trimaculatus TaxID=147232 RepID=UPI003D9E1334